MKTQMNEEDFEDVVKLALTGYAKENDLPLLVETVQEKGFNEGAGLVVRLGGNEFCLAIRQTLFEDAEVGQ